MFSWDKAAKAILGGAIAGVTGLAVAWKGDNAIDTGEWLTAIAAALVAWQTVYWKGQNDGG